MEPSEWQRVFERPKDEIDRLTSLRDAAYHYANYVCLANANRLWHPYGVNGLRCGGNLHDCSQANGCQYVRFVYVHTRDGIAYQDLNADIWDHVCQQHGAVSLDVCLCVNSDQMHACSSELCCLSSMIGCDAWGNVTCPISGLQFRYNAISNTDWRADTAKPVEKTHTSVSITDALVGKVKWEVPVRRETLEGVIARCRVSAFILFRFLLFGQRRVSEQQETITDLDQRVNRAITSSIAAKRRERKPIYMSSLESIWYNETHGKRRHLMIRFDEKKEETECVNLFVLYVMRLWAAVLFSLPKEKRAMLKLQNREFWTAILYILKDELRVNDTLVFPGSRFLQVQLPPVNRLSRYHIKDSLFTSFSSEFRTMLLNALSPRTATPEIKDAFDLRYVDTKDRAWREIETILFQLKESQHLLKPCRLKDGAA